MKKVTRWSPDTCGCVLEYEWDTEESESARTHTAASVVRACPAHEADNDGDDAAAKVLGKVSAENSGKNRALGHLLAELPKSQKKDRLDEDGNVIGEDFKVQPEWSFTEDRKLRISHPELADAAAKSRFKAAVDAQLPGFVLPS